MKNSTVWIGWTVVILALHMSEHVRRDEAVQLFLGPSNKKFTRFTKTNNATASVRIRLTRRERNHHREDRLRR